ncbi:MAG: CdaR family protein [Candidatus Saelkia tenebricola]|nr:CdaR family protein [Candidatus Saelkia tenebricola]
MKVSKFLKGGFVYKIVALLLAITTYVYVRGEIGIQGIGIREQDLLKDISSKIVPVRVVLKGEPPQGYEVLRSSIKITPEKVIIVGKNDDLEKISEVVTKEIDVRKIIHTDTKSISIVPVENAINVSSKMIEVEIPIVVSQ